MSVALGERECACGDERIVLFRDEDRLRMGKILSMTPLRGSGEREVTVDSEEILCSEEIEAVVRFAGTARASESRVYSGSGAICIQACANRSGLF